MRRGAAAARCGFAALWRLLIVRQKLAPKWNALAEKLAGVKDLRIAKIDGTANEVSGLTIQSYPTFMFFPKGKDGTVAACVPRPAAQPPLQFEYYSGGRSMADFAKYIKVGACDGSPGITRRSPRRTRTLTSPSSTPTTRTRRRSRTTSLGSVAG